MYVFKGALPYALQVLVSWYTGLIERTKIDPRLIEDVAVGNVLPPSSGASIARMATLAAVRLYSVCSELS